MTIGDFFRNILTVSAVVALLLPLESQGLSMYFQPIDAEIEKTPVIVVGRFADATGKIFIADEVIKSPVKLPERIDVRNEVPLRAHWATVAQTARRIGTEQTIFFAKWSEEEKAIVPAMSLWSFWPQASPYPKEGKEEDKERNRVLPYSTVPELRDYIMKTVKRKS